MLRVGLIHLLPVLLFETVFPNEVCQADGSGCFKDEDVACVSWRQTGGCSPDGPREPHGDLRCHEEVDTGRSGYCECAGGRRAKQVTCDHRKFACEVACKQLREYTCVSWRQTGGCDPDGEREPNNDKSCDEVISSTMSGYCECGADRRIRKPGCEHGKWNEDFRCRDLCSAEPDLYEELGLDSSSSERTIKQAFRKLSLKYHPDKTRNDPLASFKFSSIREAYDIISDPESRGIYDSMGLKKVFEARNNKMEKGPQSTMEVQASLSDLYNGADLVNAIQRKVICRGCAERHSSRCDSCNARCANEIEIVNVRMGPMIMQQQQEVGSKQKCRMATVELNIHVEPGMANGDTITFKAMGEHQPGKIPGDVVLQIKEKRHDVFKRKGQNLHTTIKISLKEALLGFERNFEQLDGRTIHVTVNGITPPNGVVKIHGEGMPHRGDPTQRGDLFIKCSYRMPEEISQEQRAWLEANFPS